MRRYGLGIVWAFLLRVGLLLPLAVQLLGCGADDTTPPDFSKMSVRQLIQTSANADADIRQGAVEALADRTGAEIPPALRQRLGKERVPTVRLALRYALASHGDRDSAQSLVGSIESNRYLATDYLQRLSGRRLMGRDARWKAWLDKTTPEDLRRIAEKRRIRIEWLKFSSAKVGEFFSQFSTDGVSLSELSEEDKQALESPNARAWVLFTGGEYRELLRKFPKTYYAEKAKELADLLDRMAKEDKAWVEPENPQALSLAERIRYNIYHLRNVSCYQSSQPGMCSVLTPSYSDPDEYNAAIELKKIGRPAIAALIGLLDDRRPTHSVGYWRFYEPTCTILRYQDAAIQILNEVLPVRFYRRTSTAAYLSNEDPEYRQEVITSIRRWYAKSKGKSVLEQKWLALEEISDFESWLCLAKSLASDHAGQKQETKKVIEALHREYQARHPVYRPHLVFLLCDLGDLSKVSGIADQYLAGECDDYPSFEPATMFAGDCAEKIIVLYGTKQYRLRLLRYNAEMFCTLAADDSSLPETYDRRRFPLHLLITLLEDQEVMQSWEADGRKGTQRRCDRAADAIQKFTKIKFGYYEFDTQEQKDAAIGRIKQWWKTKIAPLPSELPTKKGRQIESATMKARF